MGEMINTRTTLREYLESSPDDYIRAWFIKPLDSGMQRWTKGDYLLHIESWEERQVQQGTSMLVQDVRGWLDGEVHLLHGEVYLRKFPGTPLEWTGITPLTDEEGEDEAQEA